ncbi:MAG: hypothetical protein JXP34_23130 [Planctomycetes bacterium]|nr:hypothetical protein [Planctomycetota bacterium]
MERIVLFHWNAAEAEERAKRLREPGREVRAIARVDPSILRVLRDDPPDAFVIDLGRLPSQGREVAAFLRRKRATRAVPIVFAGDAPDKNACVRALLPDAAYTGWAGICAVDATWSGLLFARRTGRRRREAGRPRR